MISFKEIYFKLDNYHYIVLDILYGSNYKKINLYYY